MALSRVLPNTRHWPVYGQEPSRAIELVSKQGLPASTLMYRAAVAVARLARALHPHAHSAWVVAGPGGNGGDGLHAAAELASAGWSVTVTLLADATHLAPECAHGLSRAQTAGANFVSIDQAPRADVVIDALLGLGANRALSPSMAAAAARIATLRTQGARCLAVDMPSGLSADSGWAPSADAVLADVTLALLTLKPGHFTGQGRQRCGELWFDDLDVVQDITLEDIPRCTAQLSGAQWLALLQPSAGHDAHKGVLGDVLIVGGAPGMLGAARLAAHAAQAAGAGRTLLSLLDEHAATGDITRPEWIWVDAAWRWEVRELQRHVVVCGCGGSEEVSEALPSLLADTHSLVLDADALNAIARDPALQTLLADRASRGQATILTPHPLEAARMLNTHTQGIQADRLASAQALSDRFHAVTVLKGSGTVIAAPGQIPWINSTGNDALAHGGSGDVLAGWVGGLWARWRAVETSHKLLRDSVPAVASNAPPGLWSLALSCTCASVWLHGAAADRFPRQASRALNLVEEMHRLSHGD